MFLSIYLSIYYGTYLTDYNELFLLLWIPGDYSSQCEVNSSLPLWQSDWRSTLFYLCCIYTFVQYTLFHVIPSSCLSSGPFIGPQHKSIYLSISVCLCIHLSNCFSVCLGLFISTPLGTYMYLFTEGSYTLCMIKKAYQRVKEAFFLKSHQAHYS